MAETSPIRTKKDRLRPATWAPSVLKWAKEGPGKDLPDRVADYMAKYLIHVELYDYAGKKELTIFLLEKWTKKYSLELDANKVYSKGTSIKKDLQGHCAKMRRNMSNNQYKTNYLLALPILKD